MRVAWNMACGDQPSGSVRYKISSQLLSVGMILKALGSGPARYRARTLPTLGCHATGLCRERISSAADELRRTGRTEGANDREAHPA